jgi:hypothetical protein
MKKTVDVKKIKEIYDLRITVFEDQLSKENVSASLFKCMLSCATLGLYLADTQVNRIRDIYKVSKKKFLLEKVWGQDGAEASREMSFYCNLFYFELIFFGEHKKDFYNRYMVIGKENYFDAFDMRDPAEYFYFIDLAVIGLNHGELQFASKVIKELNSKKKNKLGSILDRYCNALISNDIPLISSVKIEYLKHLNRVKDPSDLLLGQNYDYYYLYHFRMNENGSPMDMITHAIENEYMLK